MWNIFSVSFLVKRRHVNKKGSLILFCYAETGIIVNKKHKLLYKGKGHMAGQKKNSRKKSAQIQYFKKHSCNIFYTHSVPRHCGRRWYQRLAAFSFRLLVQ